MELVLILLLVAPFLLLFFVYCHLFIPITPSMIGVGKGKYRS